MATLRLLHHLLRRLPALPTAILTVVFALTIFVHFHVAHAASIPGLVPAVCTDLGVKDGNTSTSAEIDSSAPAVPRTFIWDARALVAARESVKAGRAPPDLASALSAIKQRCG